MESSLQKKTYGINMKDKVAYAMGDAACALSFTLLGSYLQMFYTDVLYINPSKIMVLFLVARIWDAINDPLWGAVVDRRKVGSEGKFKPYLRWLSFPIAMVSILMFVKIPGLSENQYLIFAYITYIGYGMLYTGINIPYGSLASVITTDEVERSSLSVFRSIGAGLGGLPCQILFPLLVFSSVAGSDDKVLDGTKLTISVAVLAVMSIFAFNICNKYTIERVSSVRDENSVKPNLKRTIITLFKNRAFISLCLASMFLVCMQQYTQTLYNYLFKDYFHKPELFSLVTIFTYLPMVILIPFMGKLVTRFGKKELCSFGAVLAVAANLILWLIRTQSVGVFFVLCFFSGLGITFFTLEVWAIVTDLIDYHEKLTGIREEGVLYAFFSFTRKLGHAISGTLGAGILSVIDYKPENISAETVDKMYTAATLVPVLLMGAMAILLVFVYPLSKKKLREIYGDRNH